MSTFVNTVDTVGDEALATSIIDRSITELQDNVIATIGKYAFYNCLSLETVACANAETIGNAAFQGCTSLERAVFPKAKTLAENPFHGCSNLKFVEFGALERIGSSGNDVLYTFKGATKLETLIIRSSTVCSVLGQQFDFPAGYLYVPTALVAAYKGDSRWKSFADRIRAIEDYPEICDPYSWVAVSKTIENGTYKDVYKIGDTVPVDLGSEGIINMQIAAFDADTLADGSGTAAISWVAKELLKTLKRMNPARGGSSGAYTEGTGAIGGWEKCELRTYLQNTIKPLIPADVASVVVPVSKTHPAYDTTGASFTQTTTDEVWLPSKAEVNDTGSAYIGLFPDYESKTKKRFGMTNKQNWWLRSGGSSTSFGYVSTSGFATSDTATYTYGIALGFCTGRTP